MKKILLILLLVSMLFAFAACGGEQGGLDSLVSSDYVYVPEYVYIEGEGLDNIQSPRYYDGMLYFSSYGVIGTQEPTPEALEATGGVVEDWMTEVYGPMLYKVNLDGNGLTQLENYQPISVPEGSQGDASISSFILDHQGNIWVVERLYTYSYDENGNWQDGGETYYLRKLDNTGSELAQVDLTPLTEDVEWFYINAVSVDSEGRLYIACDRQIYVMDAETGAVSFEIEFTDDEWISTIVNLADGKVGASMSTSTGQVIKEIDPAAKGWGKTIEMPVNAYNLYAGGGEYLFYCSDGSYLYGINAATGESEALLNWIDSDINTSNLSSVLPLEDGRVICLSYASTYEDDGTWSSEMELAILTKTPADQVQEKTVLTLATMWLSSDLRTSIIDFNKTNGQYRIQVTDYSIYNTPEDSDAGLTKLNTDIVAGHIPDILNVSSLPVAQYAGRGLLEDLYPYIDNDSELSRDALVQEVLHALEIDGHLYQAVPSFTITTLVGASSVVGDEPGWTFEEMKAVLEAHPEASAFSPYVTRETILSYFMTFNQDNYVDWQTGECDFDGEDFISMLEFAKSFPETYDWESEEYIDEYQLIREGKVLLSMANFYDFSNMYTYPALFGGDVTYIGFPTEEGCGSVIAVNTGLAMSSASQHKDAAWSFIRTLFTEKYQKRNSWELPTNKAVFDEVVKEAMTEETYTDENGVQVVQPKYTIGYGDGTEIEVYAMTQEQYDQFMDLLSRIDSVASIDSSIADIVLEETGPYFAGQKTVEETASVIQSRVKLYVNEQR